MVTGNFILIILWGISILISIPIIAVLLIQLVKAIVDYCRWVRIGKQLNKTNYFNDNNCRSYGKGERQEKSPLGKLSIFERWNKLAECGYQYEHRSDKNDDTINNHQQVYINPISYFKELYRIQKLKSIIRESNHK